MSLLSFFRRTGFAAAALAMLALGAAGAVAPRAEAAAPGQAAHLEPAHHDHHHAKADVGRTDSIPADHDGHATGRTCGDACCGPVGCALPVPPIASRSTAVTEVVANWLPAEALADLDLAYSIERPPRG